MIHCDLMLTIDWGCIQWCITMTRSVDSLAQRVLRFPGSGILVPGRHGQIFISAQVWHGMSQVLVQGSSLEWLVWQEQLGPGSSGLPVLQVQQMWAACTVQVGAMQVVQCLVGACSVAVVPLGTVSTALTLCS